MGNGRRECRGKHGKIHGPLPIMRDRERGTAVRPYGDHRALLGNRVTTRAGFIFRQKNKERHGNAALSLA
jgi:hypothetical protein